MPFEIAQETEDIVQIKVIGVGGGGGNAVNTMIAAYRAGTRAPKLTFYESGEENAAEIVSLPVVYDKNVGKNVESGDAESSVLRFENGTFKNEFVDTGAQSTKLYFELADENLAFVAPAKVIYRIKWGDTLWDLAESYYKNPWLYHKIAKANNIKNPDHIISGTFIEIPEE